MVPVRGRGSYYDFFSDILIINRGVHEPLEEFVFQEMVSSICAAPVMLELGAYWGHYSMWLKKRRPHARVFLVEPDAINLQAGRENFDRNGLSGTFINDMVGTGAFEVDRFVADQGLTRLDVLHADIQGAEIEMLDGCQNSFRSGKVQYCFVSTHSQALHIAAAEKLLASGFRIEASADCDSESTSCDGLIFAAHASAPSVVNGFRYMGRTAICGATPHQLLAAANSYAVARAPSEGQAS